MEDLKLRQAIRAMVDAYIVHLNEKRDELVDMIYRAIKASEKLAKKKGIDYSGEKRKIIEAIENNAKHPEKSLAPMSIHVLAMAIAPKYLPYLFNAIMYNLNLFTATLGQIVDIAFISGIADSPEHIRIILDPIAVANTHSTTVAMMVGSAAKEDGRRGDGEK